MSRRKMRTRRRGTRAPPYGAGALSACRGRRLDVPSARRCRAGGRIPAPVCTPRALASRRALARNDSTSRCLGGRSHPSLQVFIGDSRAGRRGRRPLQGGQERGDVGIAPYGIARDACMRDVEDGVSDGITRRPAGMRLRVAPIRLTTFRDAGMIAVVPSHS